MKFNQYVRKCGRVKTPHVHGQRLDTQGAGEPDVDQLVEALNSPIT